MPHAHPFAWLRRAATQAVQEIEPDDLNARAYAAGVAPQVMREWLQVWAHRCPRVVFGFTSGKKWNPEKAEA